MDPDDIRVLNALTMAGRSSWLQPAPDQASLLADALDAYGRLNGARHTRADPATAAALCGPPTAAVRSGLRDAAPAQRLGLVDVQLQKQVRRRGQHDRRRPRPARPAQRPELAHREPRPRWAGGCGWVLGRSTTV